MSDLSTFVNSDENRSLRISAFSPECMSPSIDLRWCHAGAVKFLAFYKSIEPLVVFVVSWLIFFSDIAITLFEPSAKFCRFHTIIHTFSL